MRFFRLGTANRVCAAGALPGVVLAGVVLGSVVLAGAAAVPAIAQVPMPQSPEAADIAACLCLQRALDTLGAVMTERKGAYEASRQEVADLDAQLQSARMSLNVDNPEAVAQFRQLLERRDAAYRRSSGPFFSQYGEAVQRYDARIAEYNARCANRPRNPVLLNQVQATLVCPPVP